MDVAEAARRYSELGWALVHLNGKTPIGYGWERTHPLDPDDARDIWSRRSGNMGVVLGNSGIIDYEHDSGPLDEYLALVGGKIPATPSYETGNGRIHILFRDVGHLTRRTREGKELRAGNHQSVLPPSVHPETGEKYKWIIAPWDVPLADPPPQLLEFFAQSTGSGADTHWRQPIRTGLRLGPGEGRHESTISFLGKMVNVFDNPEQLVAAAITYAELTQDPPYTEAELTTWAYRVWDRYREEQEQAGSADTLAIKRLDRFEIRSVKFLWKPYLQRSAFHLLVGRKGAGKGSVLAWIAAQETSGQFDDHARGVLWIATEDSIEIDVKPRIIAQGGDPQRVFVVNKRVKLPDDLPAIEQACIEHGIGMVVIDPIAGVISNADSNSEGPITEAIGGLNDLADRLDLMVMGVRHLGKNIDRGALEAVLGNVAWVNIPRVVLGMAQDEEEKVVTLQVLAGNRTRSRESFDFNLEEAKIRGVEEPVSKVVPIGDSFKDIGDVLTKTPRGKKYEAARQFVLTAIEDHTPCTKEGLLPLVHEATGASKDTLDRVVKDLRDAGVLKFLPRPKGPDGEFISGTPWTFVRV